MFFVFINFSKIFHEYIRMGNKDCKNENIDGKYLENMGNYQFLKVKSGLLELEKDLTKLEDREVKYRKEKKEKKRWKNYFIRPIISKWFDWLIKQNMMEKKPKIV